MRKAQNGAIVIAHYVSVIIVDVFAFEDPEEAAAFIRSRLVQPEPKKEPETDD